MEDQEDRTPRDDGSEPVREHPPEAAGPGRSATQIVVVVVAALVLLAALLWLVVPLVGG